MSSGLLYPSGGRYDDGRNVINYDKAHGGYPRHFDMLTRTSFGAHKLRITKKGELITDNTVVSDRKI